MSSIVKVDTIQENTSANGITVDGLNIKDSKLVTANSVVAANITADAIDATKIADNAISEEHLDVTSITGHTAETSIADGDTILIHDASASALRKMTKANFVSGIGGSNTPSFLANKSSAQSIANTTAVQVTFDNELYDSDGKFASNRFTPTVAGKYFIYSQLNMVATDGKYFETRIHKNGSLISVTQTHMGTVTYNAGSYIGQVITSDDNDYFEIFTYHNSGASKNVDGGNTGSSYFGAFKIIE